MREFTTLRYVLTQCHSPDGPKPTLPEIISPRWTAADLDLDHEDDEEWWVPPDFWTATEVWSWDDEYACYRGYPRNPPEAT